MFVIIDNNKGEKLQINKSIYETEEQFLDKIVFFLCCMDNGTNMEKSETLCNVFRNQNKYKVKYPIEVENEVKKLKEKYNLN
jgi:hypothetical protein